MVSAFVLSQIVVSTALVFDMVSVQMGQRYLLITGQAIAAALISAHFFLLDTYTAGWMFALGSCRLLISLRWRGTLVKAVFYSLIVAFGIYSYQGPVSYISTAAGLLMAMGSFANSMKGVRLFFIAGSSTWLLHNLLIWTPMGIVTEAVFVASNLLAYYRFVVRPPGSQSFNKYSGRK